MNDWSTEGKNLINQFAFFFCIFKDLITACLQKLNPIQNIIKALLFAITSFGYGNVQAQNKTNQPHEYIFSSYTAANGLASSEILTLAVDEKGFLWAGTNAGLSRYDGYTFTNITYSADKHLIGMVNIIKTDSMGKLWIGASSGLYCYWQNRLIKISTDKNTPQSVNDIISETDGSLWVTTENGPAYITAADIGLTGTKKIILQNFILPLYYLTTMLTNLFFTTISFTISLPSI